MCLNNAAQPSTTHARVEVGSHMKSMNNHETSIEERRRRHVRSRRGPVRYLANVFRLTRLCERADTLASQSVIHLRSWGSWSNYVGRVYLHPFYPYFAV